MLPSAPNLAAQAFHTLLERRLVVRLRASKAVVQASTQDQPQPSVGPVTLLHHQRNHVHTEAKASVSALAQGGGKTEDGQASLSLVGIVRFQPTISALLVAPADPVQHHLRALHCIGHRIHDRAFHLFRLQC